MLSQPEQLGGERLLRQGLGATAPDARRDFDDVVVCEPGQHAVVSHVDLVHHVVAAQTSDATSPTAASL